MDFPVFGLPTRATVSVLVSMGWTERAATRKARCGSSESHGDARGFGLAEAQAGIPEADLDRVAERGEGENFDRLAFEQPELVEALHEGGFAGDGQRLRHGRRGGGR